MSEPLTPEVGEVVEALRAPSFKQDSQWHHDKAVYATKPRDLLTQAAALIERLAREVGENEARAEMHWQDRVNADNTAYARLLALRASESRAQALEEEVGRLRSLLSGGGGGSSQSQPSGRPSPDGEVTAGLDAEPSAPAQGDLYREPRPAQLPLGEWFERLAFHAGYDNGSALVADTGACAWMDFYTAGLTPAEAWTEDCANA